jgi:hypothetical protein
LKIHHSSKLFYGKYAYKVVLLTNGMDCGLSKLSDWCNSNIADQDYKLVNRHHDHCDWHQMVYVHNEQVRDNMLTAFGADVVEIWQPLDSDHLKKLSVRNVVQVRSTLIFKKYNHAIYFLYDRLGGIEDWLMEYYQGRTDVRVSGSRWWPKLYIQGDHLQDEITAIELTWPNCIDYVRTVRLISPL